jgi:regulator of protease activity HflC (stomatin/prohibitin superfamily)
MDNNVVPMTKTEASLGISALLLVIMGITALFMWGCPTYRVWQQTKEGEAALRRAEQDRQIAVQEARAKEESAKLLAGAEVERAKGVAEANKIIGDGLKGNDEYLRYLWLHSLETTAAQGDKVIYVPTEANLPILEAQRLNGGK